MRKFFNDECGAIVSAEIVIVLSIAVLAMIVGLSEVAVAVNTELNDISNAIGRLNQTYSFTGFGSTKTGAATAKNSYAGSTWVDSEDDCDSNASCNLVCGASATTTDEK